MLGSGVSGCWGEWHRGCLSFRGEFNLSKVGDHAGVALRVVRVFSVVLSDSFSKGLGPQPELLEESSDFIGQRVFVSDLK